jgi:hypothetical protein
MSRHTFLWIISVPTARNHTAHTTRTSVMPPRSRRPIPVGIAATRHLGFAVCGRRARQVLIDGVEDDEVLMELFL